MHPNSGILNFQEAKDNMNSFVILRIQATYHCRCRFKSEHTKTRLPEPLTESIADYSVCQDPAGMVHGSLDFFRIYLKKIFDPNINV
jgi:hypothetical protein